MVCILCGSAQHKVIRTKVRYDIKRNVLQCKNCGFVYLESLRDVSRGYYAGAAYRKRYGPNLKKSANAREIFNTYFPAQADIVAEIAHVLRPRTTVLDVGCSTGHFLEALKGRVGPRVGLELGNSAVRFIKKNLKFPIYNQPIESVKIKEAPFDLITALQVLEHVENPEGFLRGISNNLKPDGYLYLELPNINDVLLRYLRVPGYEDFYYREPHLSYFSAQTLKLLLDKVGFVGEIKTVQRYNFLNHMHWVMTDHPQDNFAVGNGIPVLAPEKAANDSARAALNDFIANVDRSYKKLVVAHGLGESLTFLGKKKA